MVYPTFSFANQRTIQGVNATMLFADVSQDFLLVTDVGSLACLKTVAISAEVTGRNAAFHFDQATSR